MMLQRTKAARALALVMLVGLAGCGTVKQNSVSNPRCLRLGAELAAAKTPQHRAETKEAGIAVGCWPRR